MSIKSNKSGQQTFALYYLCTGRMERDYRTNEIITVQATSERGAKAAFTRQGNYRNWEHYAFVPYVDQDAADKAQCARHDADQAVMDAANNL